MADSKEDFDRSIGFLISDVARLLRRDFDRRVKGLGLTRTQWLVLAHLFRQDGQTQSELATELEMERAPLGRIIDRLEENGWIKRTADPKDRRVNRVQLTDKFEPHKDDLILAAEKLYETAFADISQKDLERMIDNLQKAKRNLT